MMHSDDLVATARERKTPYPEDVDDLVTRCRTLCNKYDLFQLGEPPQHDGWPDGTDDLSGEYQYGVAMIPARWVLNALGFDVMEED